MARFCFLNSFFLVTGLVTGLAAAAQQIPKTIIQTSPAGAERPDWTAYQLVLRKNNPGYKFLHFNDDEALAFMEEHYADTVLLQTYMTVPNIMKTDLFRLAAVLVMGGFYMDMDMLSRQSFDSLIEELDASKHHAVFPQEWWMSDKAYHSTFPGRWPQDEEDHWQVGNYAFGAVAGHDFVKDVLQEATVRSIRLMQNKEEDDITDIDVLATTGPYTLTETYHRGRKEGKYQDLYHMRGDDSEPTKQPRSRGGNDWHKFGEYCEHMLTHSWVKTSRELQDSYEEHRVVDDDAFLSGASDSYRVVGMVGAVAATLVSCILI